MSLSDKVLCSPLKDRSRTAAVDEIAQAPHAGQLLRRHGPALQYLQVLPHLFDVLRPRHADVDRRMGQHEAVAFGGRGRGLAGRHLTGIQELAVLGRGEGNNAGPVFAGEEGKCLGLSAAMGGAVAEVENVEDAFPGQLGEQLAVMAGHPDEPDEALYFKLQGAVDEPRRGALGEVAQDEDVGMVKPGALKALAEEMFG